MKFGPFLGLNNLLHIAALTVYDKGRAAGQYLRHAFNVDLDPAGRVQRRAGYTLVESMSGAHSLWSDGARTLFVRAGALYEITDLSAFTEALLTSLAADDTMRYESINGDVYFSNGTDSGRLLSGASAPEPWALATPSAPVVSLTTGNLLAGSYLLSLTFSRASGEEGGASPAQSVELLATGGINVTLPSGPPGAAFINLYLSARDGEAMTLNTSVAVGIGSVVLDSLSAGVALATEFLEPQPAGNLLAEHYSRLLVADGGRMTVSQPRRPGMLLPSKGFVRFPDDITNVVPCAGGVYVTTTARSYWLDGPDPVEAAIRVILPYGASAGSRFKLPNDPRVGWFGDQGLVLADEAGAARAIQGETLATDTADTAVTLVREVSGQTAVLAVLSGNVTPSPLAQTDVATEEAERLHGL